MDEIEQRLRTATDACISSYDAWRKNPKGSDMRENLMEAVHELRKVAARLEIEIAISERDEMAARPIPIPPHRASRKRENGVDDNIGNAAEPSEGGGGGGQHSGFRERSGGPRRSGGGGGGHGGPRRSHGGGGGGGGGNRSEE